MGRRQRVLHYCKFSSDQQIYRIKIVQNIDLITVNDRHAFPITATEHTPVLALEELGNETKAIYATKKSVGADPKGMVVLRRKEHCFYKHLLYCTYSTVSTVLCTSAALPKNLTF